MGTGKSSVGKALGKKLKRPVIDLDENIEAAEKRSIRDIFEKDGEAHFRSLEKKAVQALSGERGVVITTGGGAVLDEDNRRVLKKNGILITLSATPEAIYTRVKHSGHRPLLNHGDPLSEIKRLLLLREPYYRQSDISIDTDGKKPAQVAEEILTALEGRLHGQD